MRSEKLSGVKKVLGIVSTVVLFILTIAVLVSSFISRRQNKPNFIFGYALLWVKTGSMEPTIPERSYIIVKESNGEELEIGTVITYYCRDTESPVYGNLITHRIIGIESSGYLTKGDRPEAYPDRISVSSEDVVATYVCSLPILTVCGRVFASPIGLMISIAIFIGTLAFFYIPDIIDVIVSDKYRAKLREREIARRIEEEVRKMEENNRKGKGK